MSKIVKRKLKGFGKKENYTKKPLKNAFLEGYFDKLIKNYMKKHRIPKITVTENSVMVVQPMRDNEKQFWINQWLDGKISTERIMEFVTKSVIRYCDTYYFLEDFYEMIIND